MRALLVHSPLVGPSSIQRLAGALAELGWDVVAPDLRAGITSPDAFVHLATRAARGADVVVGHSGAGAMLPLIAPAVGATMLFVDAIVPGPAGHAPSVGFVALLDGLPVDGGLLAPWHEWWPAGTMERLVPDPIERELVTADVPRVPRSFYDHPVSLPDGWWTARSAAYLQLSPAYDEDRARAEAYGWPVAVLDGQHLDLFIRPAEVAASVLELTDRLR